MAFGTSPLFAAWRHRGFREGFEVVSIDVGATGVRIQGNTAAVEEGQAWAVRYLITLDDAWITRRAEVWNLSEAGEGAVTIELDPTGRWRVDGVERPDLDGCHDVDLESSACTNTIPVHRLALAPGATAEAPAVYVRATDLAVERLEQSYTRVPSASESYDYRAPRFEFDDRLTYDEDALILDYPGIAERAL